MTSLTLETVLDFGGTRGGLEDVNGALGDVLDAPEVLAIEEPKKLDAGMDWLPLVLAGYRSNQLRLACYHTVHVLRDLKALLYLFCRSHHLDASWHKGKVQTCW